MTHPAQLPSIAFLGTGLMGKPMATRLLRAGYAVTVWNRTLSKAQSLVSDGAQCATTALQAVQSADVIITMLEAGPIVADVLNDALDGISPVALVIDMSSTRQDEAVAMHHRLSSKGIACLDAPVSGGVLGAEAGTLAIMAGGAHSSFVRAQPILANLGRAMLVGGPGTGQVAKLCNQLIVGATLNIVAEALLLAQAAGADPVAVRSAIRGGFAESRILEVHGQRMLDRDFRPGGQVKSQAKDMENILRAAADAGVRLPVTELVTENYRSILLSLPSADQSAILLALEQQNPGFHLGNASSAHDRDRLA